MHEQQLPSIFVLFSAFIRESKEQSIALENIYIIVKLLHVFTESLFK